MKNRENISTDLLAQGYLERPIFTEAHNKLTMEYEHLIAKHGTATTAEWTMPDILCEQALNELVIFLNRAETFTEWDESLFERFVERVKVISREKVEFELKFGLKLKERID